MSLNFYHSITHVLSHSFLLEQCLFVGSHQANHHRGGQGVAQEKYKRQQKQQHSQCIASCPQQNRNLRKKVVWEEFKEDERRQERQEVAEEFEEEFEEEKGQERQVREISRPTGVAGRMGGLL